MDYEQKVRLIKEYEKKTAEIWTSMVEPRFEDRIRVFFEASADYKENQAIELELQNLKGLTMPEVHSKCNRAIKCFRDAVRKSAIQCFITQKTKPG